MGATGTASDDARSGAGMRTGGKANGSPTTDGGTTMGATTRKTGTGGGALRGTEVLGRSLSNKGTAFSEREREELGLVGLLPAAVETLEEQAKRAYGEYSKQPDDLAKNVYMMA